jgi:hypothetical protein
MDASMPPLTKGLSLSKRITKGQIKPVFIAIPRFSKRSLSDNQLPIVLSPDDGSPWEIILRVTFFRQPASCKIARIDSALPENVKTFQIILNFLIKIFNRNPPLSSMPVGIFSVVLLEASVITVRNLQHV